MKLRMVAAKLDDTNHLQIHIRWGEGPVPRAGSVLWVLTGGNGDGQRFDFGYKIVDRLPSALYIFDHALARQTNCSLPVAGDYDDESGSLTARLPWPAELDYTTWRWDKAVLNIDGTDVDQRVVSTVG